MEITDYSTVNSNYIRMMVNRNGFVQYKINFLEASRESGNRFKCSPGENDRKEKEY